jgi:ADP-ribose pyrophosphatase YjhB (NUDIX family)
MHHLQQHILRQLILSDQLNYAKLKPKGVEGNLFTYHLGKLIAEGLVGKSDSSYQLSAEGKRYADGLSLKTFEPRAQASIVTLMICRNSYGDYLLFRRRKQPLIGMVGFPYGKVHLGETVLEAAERELKEKTGVAAELSHRGDGYVTIHKAAEPISQIFFHLILGTSPAGPSRHKTRDGESFWAKPYQVEPQDLIPSVPDLIKALEQSSTSRFFAELKYELKTDPQMSQEVR